MPRRVAVAMAGMFLAWLIGCLWGYHAGSADVTAQWQAAAKQEVLTQQVVVKNDHSAAVRQEDWGRIGQISREQVDALRKADATCHPITADELR